MGLSLIHIYVKGSNWHQTMGYLRHLDCALAVREYLK